jgi:hypothetical protein
MRELIIGRRGRRWLLWAAMSAMAGVLAGPGTAVAACPDQPLSQPFKRWGDTNQYFLWPSGDMEGKLSGWFTRGTSLGDNEPWLVNSSTDERSLVLNENSTVWTSAICVDHSMPTFRLFARQLDPGAQLEIDLVFRDGKVTIVDEINDLADGSMPTWALSLPLQLASALPVGGEETLPVRLRLRTTSSAWQIDNIYVDPYRNG